MANRFVLNETSYHGAGAIAEIATETRSRGFKKAFVCSDPDLVKFGVTQKVLDVLDKNGMAYELYSNIKPNPTIENVQTGVQAFKDAKTDYLIAIGGGSSMDTAKAIGIIINNPEHEDVISLEGAVDTKNKSVPIFAVPTTAGTAAEVTINYVITDAAKNRKMVCVDPHDIPVVAFIDPDMMSSMPKGLTAATGMDALTHAIEAYTATCSEPIADAVSLYAIELIYNNLKTAVFEGDNLQARSAMLMGSMLAGIGFSHSDVASVHCISEALGGMFDLAHGVCNAVLLPHVMEYNKDYCVAKYARVAKAMGFEFKSDDEGADLAVKAVQQLALDVKLPLFSELNVEPKDFDILADKSAINISTESNPRPMSKEDYLNVLNNAYNAK